MDHDINERHTYFGTREETDKLIAWLLNGTYWFDVCWVSSSQQYSVTCGCEPRDLAASGIKVHRSTSDA